MRSWTILLGGLLVWAAHFFALYGIGEFAGASAASRDAVLLISALALAADGLLFRRLLRLPHDDEFGRWRTGVASGGLGLSALAIVWQTLPALVG
ncbi:MAG: hypothetical protein Q7T68_02215 [Sphingopyxis sp.]|nr:hypothetical protein [Sphingopyxis sp.]